MILSAIPTFIKNRNNPNYASLGASGAVSGVVFGFILYNPLSRIYIMFIPIGIPAFIYAVLYLVYCVYASKRQSGNINHSAHFWGSLAGVIIAVIFDPQVLEGFIQRISGFELRIRTLDGADMHRLPENLPRADDSIPSIS